MNKLLAGLLGALAAFAAQAQDWSGAYGGVSLARFKGSSTWTTNQLGDPAVCPPTCFSGLEGDLGATGVQYAAHLGYNWALGRNAFVGLEGGVGNVNSRGRIDRTPGWMEDMQFDRITATYEWNASVVGRVGVGAGPLFLYGLLGPTWQKMSIRFECGDPAGPNSWCLGGPITENRADVRFGIVGGVGAEWRLHSRWAARLDFRYARYEDKEYSFFGNTATDQVFANTTLRTSALALGVSYRF